MRTTKIAIAILVSLMLSASVVYFAAAYEESIGEDSDEDHETIPDNDENDEIGKENIQETELPEAAFFSLVGLAYIPVSGWMIQKKHGSRKPYVVALIGSLAMIVFYVLTRTVDLPIIGLQTDVGITDTVAKILQVGAVALCGFLIYKIDKIGKN